MKVECSLRGWLPVPAHLETAAMRLIPANFISANIPFLAVVGLSLAVLACSAWHKAVVSD